MSKRITKKTEKKRKINRVCNRIFDVVRPTPKSWKWGAFLLRMIGLIIWFVVILVPLPASVHGGWTTLLATVVFAIGAVLLGKLATDLLGLLQKMPKPYTATVLGIGFLLFAMMLPMRIGFLNTAAVVIYVIVSTFLIGWGVGALKEVDKEQQKNPVVSIGALVAGIIALIVAIVWVVMPGPTEQRSWVQNMEIPVDEILLEDPAAPGPYTVMTLTYGSGTDQRRPEYGKNAAFVTEPVDISAMVEGSGPLSSRIRQSFWGFDLSQAPLNGRVWYPDGEGPFPLVLIVHGNHAMDRFSDPGYAYLGELLASRGYITVSVDQNFLNGAGLLEFILGEIRNENDARAYIMLQHLAVWHQWNEMAGHPFAGKLDTDKIALIGHSRGGEAVAIAAVFNRLSSHPEHGHIPFSFGYEIGAVIGIAPSDGQYSPRKQAIVPTDINYLVMHGSLDYDLHSFIGTRQYDRIRFSGEEQVFKAAVYIEGANHGQFNTRWGGVDLFSARWFLNKGAIMPSSEQERAAKVWMSAFLEAALHDHTEYERLFQNPALGSQHLPVTTYRTQYQRANIMMLADFSEDMDLQTATVENGKLMGENLSVWREERPLLADGILRDVQAVRIGWRTSEDETPSYVLTLPMETMDPADRFLVFDAANMGRENAFVDFTIQLTDRTGNRAKLHLSSIGSLPPPPNDRLLKPPMQQIRSFQPMFTTYVFALADFAAVNPNLDVKNLREIRFLFDRTKSGQIYLGQLGFFQIP